MKSLGSFARLLFPLSAFALAFAAPKAHAVFIVPDCETCPGTSLAAKDSIEKTLFSGQSYNGQFELGGYDPDVSSILSATATFYFLGLGSVSVSLDGSLFDTFVPTLLLGFTSGGVEGDALLSLSETGKLDYTIKVTKGVIVYGGGKLEACVVDAPPGDSKVPDGGSSAIMFGVALLGAGGVKRFLARH